MEIYNNKKCEGINSFTNIQDYLFILIKYYEFFS